MGRNKKADPRLDPAKLEALLQRLERGELSEQDRLEVVRLLNLFLQLRDTLAGSVPSLTRLRSLLSGRTKDAPSSTDPL